MYVLRIDHPVQDFEAWKKTFDGDPLQRERSGVRRYQILRSVDDPNYVMIDLEFDSPDDAAALRSGLLELWGRVEGTGLIRDPQVRLAETVEAKEY